MKLALLLTAGIWLLSGAEDDIDRLLRRHLGLPIANYPASKIEDTFRGARSGHDHEAIDLPSPRGTPVLAVDDGTIAKLFLSKPGGITIYQKDREGVYCYYYAHLDRYAAGLHEGDPVRRGQVLAYVGSTGNASPDAPHLHFTVFKLGPEQHWWQGTAIDPYRLLLQAAENAR